MKIELMSIQDVSVSSVMVNNLIYYILKNDINEVYLPENDFTMYLILKNENLLKYQDHFKMKTVKMLDVFNSYSDLEIVEAMLSDTLLPLNKTFTDIELSYLVKKFEIGRLRFYSDRGDFIQIIRQKLPKLSKIFKENSELFFNYYLKLVS